MPAPFPKKISQILPTFQNVAQTSNYLVRFSIPNSGVYPLTTHLRSKGVDDRFDLGDIGLLCSGASIPGSSFATLDVRGEYQGVIEKMAHTRQFTQIDLELSFYPFYFASAIAMWLSVLAIILWFINAISERENK